MPAARTDWTVDMLDALPDDGKTYELIDGELFVTPAPSDVHQLVVSAIERRLWSYLRPSAIARSLQSPADVRRGDKRINRLQPDVFVVRLIDGRRPSYPFELTDLLLIVEVESPSNAAYDYQTKRRLYLTSGVPEYWVVSPEAQTFARWRGSEDIGELLSTRIEWRPSGMDPSLVIDIPEFFADALG
ncbi:MAG TPA: Uma2 family endonuclease [Gemmatimonadaceae bacterium]